MTAASVVVHPEGSAIRIVMGGEIDLENALEVEEQLTAAITNETSAVTLDLADLAYLDSAAPPAPCRSGGPVAGPQWGTPPGNPCRPGTCSSPFITGPFAATSAT